MKRTKMVKMIISIVWVMGSLFLYSCGKDDDDNKSANPVTATEQSAAGTSAKIAFTNTALSQDGFTCGSLTVEIQDSTGKAVAQPADTILGLGSSESTGVFHSDSACAKVITQATIPTDSSSITIYYKQTKLAAATLTAAENPDASLTDATQAVTMVAALVGEFKGACSQNTITSKYEILTYTIASDNAMAVTTTVHGGSDTTCANAAEYAVKVSGAASIGDIAASLEKTRKYDFTQAKAEITPLTADVVSTFNTSSYCGKSDWVLNTAFDNIGNACSDLSLAAITANAVSYQLGQVKDSKLTLGSATAELDASTDAKRPTALGSTSYTKQ